MAEDESKTSNMKPVRILLWCTPRSTSTAFAKSLTAIAGNEVWFEPYAFAHYAYTLIQKDEQRDLPMDYAGNEKIFEKAAELLSVVSHTRITPERLPYATIKEDLERSTSKYVFVKDMGMAMDTDQCRQYLPSGYKHTFLLRHPTLVFASYRKAMYKQLLEAGELTGDMADERKFDIEEADRIMSTGRMFKSCYDLWRFVRENIDSNPIVIESEDLLTRPAEIMRKYCEAVGLPYSDSLLNWDASPGIMKSWTAAGEYFFRDAINFMAIAANSSCFMPASSPLPRETLTDDVIRLSDAALPLYQEMYETRLK